MVCEIPFFLVSSSQWFARFRLQVWKNLFQMSLFGFSRSVVASGSICLPLIPRLHSIYNYSAVLDQRMLGQGWVEFISHDNLI